MIIFIEISKIFEKMFTNPIIHGIILPSKVIYNILYF